MCYQIISASDLADQIRGLVSEAVNNSGTCSAPTAPPSSSLTFFFIFGLFFLQCTNSTSLLSPHLSSSLSDSCPHCAFLKVFSICLPGRKYNLVTLVIFSNAVNCSGAHRHGNQTCKESVKLRWLPDRQTDMVGSGQSNVLLE